MQGCRRCSPCSERASICITGGSARGFAHLSCECSVRAVTEFTRGFRDAADGGDAQTLPAPSMGDHPLFSSVLCACVPSYLCIPMPNSLCCFSRVLCVVVHSLTACDVFLEPETDSTQEQEQHSETGGPRDRAVGAETVQAGASGTSSAVTSLGPDDKAQMPLGDPRDLSSQQLQPREGAAVGAADLSNRGDSVHVHVPEPAKGEGGTTTGGRL